MFGTYSGITFGQWWGDGDVTPPTTAPTPKRGPLLVTLGRLMN